MDTLWQDLRYGLRTLARNPGFTAVAVLTLALGIGANASIFSVINGVLLRPLPFPDPDRLLIVWTAVPEKGIERFAVAPPDFEDWRAQNTVFEEIAIFQTPFGTLTGDELPEMVRYSRVTPGFFRVMATQPQLGRALREEENRPGQGNVAVLSYGLWQSHFGGDPEVLGQSLVLEGERLTIVGVMPPEFEFNSAQLWKPFGRRMDDVGDRGTYNTAAIARLKTEVSHEQAHAQMNSIMAGLAEQFPNKKGMTLFLEPLHEAAVREARPALLLLWAAVGFVLLIACANVANLLLARGVVRERELAIRTSLGASRLRLVRQLLTESVLLALLGGAFGLLLATWGVELLPGLAGDRIPRADEIGIDAAVMAFVLGLSLLTAIFFGLLPAFRAAGADPHGSLKEGGRTGAGTVRQRLRSMFVVTEVALAVVLLVGAGLLIRSFNNLLDHDIGFDAENLLTFRLQPKRTPYRQGQSPEEYRRQAAAERRQALHFYQDLLGRIENLTGVESATAINYRPLIGRAWAMKVSFDDRPIVPFSDMPVVQARVVFPGYFSTLRTHVLRGRPFSPQDRPGAPNVAVINDATARTHWPGGNPLGRRINMQDPSDESKWLTIVGVVHDIPTGNLEKEAIPTIYVPFAQAYTGHMDNWRMEFQVRTAGDPLELVGALRAQVQSLDNNLPVFNVN
ncbi:MAG: ABC transporter permease, partial [Terriglobia bacterium]